MRMTRFRRNLDARVLVGEGPKSTPTQSLLNAMRFDCFSRYGTTERPEPGEEPTSVSSLDDDAFAPKD